MLSLHPLLKVWAEPFRSAFLLLVMNNWFTVYMQRSAAQRNLQRRSLGKVSFDFPTSLCLYSEAILVIFLKAILKAILAVLVTFSLLRSVPHSPNSLL